MMMMVMMMTMMMMMMRLMRILTMSSRLYFLSYYPEEEVALYLTLAPIVGGTIGVFFGGAFSDRVASKCQSNESKVSKSVASSSLPCHDPPCPSSSSMASTSSYLYSS